MTEVDADLGNGVVARQYQGAHNVVPPICTRENKFIEGQCCGSGSASESGPAWIRIILITWIRIRIK